jgi:hypothetical protein
LLAMPLRVSARTSTDYEPRHDPEFIGKVASLLLENYGHPVRIGRHLHADVWVVREAVEELRRSWGFTVNATKGVPGYTLSGWQRPSKAEKGRRSRR